MRQKLLIWIVFRLWELGWSPNEDQVNNLKEILKQYQEWFQLPNQDGELDPTTYRHILLPRFCRYPDKMSLNQSQMKRPTPAGWVWSGPTLKNITDQQFKTAFQAAFNSWAEICGCAAKIANNPNQADMVSVSSQIDGPMGVLADCELPGPNIQNMRVDNKEPWIIQSGPLSSNNNQLDLQRVLTHELGHFWGMDHIVTGNLMAPMYSNDIWKPQAGDISEMQRRYGPPRSQPLPPDGGGGQPLPPKPPPTGTRIVIEIWNATNIIIPGFSVTPNP